MTEPYRGRVRTPNYSLKINLLDLIPVLFIAGGAGLIAVGWYYLPRGETAQVALLTFGAASAAWGIYTGGFCLSVYSNRWIERRLRTEIAMRPDAMVDPGSPDSTYVSLIPRENFSVVRLTMSSDLLLMRIDDQRGVLLLEGDSDRYCIPAQAIEECQAECLFHPIDAQQQNELWMVRLTVRFADGMRELLLSVGLNGWRPRTNSRRCQAAEETCARIDALRARSAGARTGL